MNIGAIGNLGRAPVPETEEVARAAWPGRLGGGLSTELGGQSSALLARVVTLAGRVHLAVVILSTVGLVLAAWARLPWVGLVLWTLAALVEWLATPADASATRLLDLVGLKAQLRALLRSLPAAALVFVTAPHGLIAGLAYVTVVLFIQLAWIGQPVLTTWLSRTAPPLLYPGGPNRNRPQPDRLDQVGDGSDSVRDAEAFAAHARVYARAVGTPFALAAIEFVALAKAIALAAQLMPVWLGLGIAALLAVAALAYLFWTALAARRVRTKQPGWGEQLVAELAPCEPRFLVYVSLAARQSKYIVNQWLPALDAIPEPGFLLVREASQLPPLAPTRLPIVYAPGQKDVERLTLPSVKAAFYLAYGERNGQLLRDPRPKHVMLLHGDSDKATSANGMAKAFDEIWVAGPMAVERYRAAGIDLPDERFVFIGRPQAAGLPSGPTGNDVPVVLYAPTFEGYYDQTAHSSLDTMGFELVRRLVERRDVQVWFRPHPSSGVARPSMLAAIDQISALLRTVPGGHLVVADQALGLPECLAKADVLITDVSSVATEFLYTGRPILTCDPAGLGASAFVETYPTAACSYLLEPDLAGLDAVLADALGTDPLRRTRAEMKARVLGDPPGGPQAAFAANVARLTHLATPDLSDSHGAIPP